jgi:hypothetical protein
VRKVGLLAMLMYKAICSRKASKDFLKQLYGFQGVYSPALKLNSKGRAVVKKYGGEEALAFGRSSRFV